MPSEIGHLTHLEELDLGNNPLTALPPEIEHLPALDESIKSALKKFIPSL